MNASILRPLALGLLCAAIVACSTYEPVSPQLAGARTASPGFIKECDVNQGYNLNQDQHPTVGYITSLTIGQNIITPDIKILDQNSLATVGAKVGTTGNIQDLNSDFFRIPVVGVLSSTSWSTLPGDNIVLTSRISAATAQALKKLPITRSIAVVGFVVYEYDVVNQKYYTSFASTVGTPINSSIKPTTGFTNISNRIWAMLLKSSTSDWAIKVGLKPESDPAGITNYSLELTLSPPTASSPQQLLIQTSDVIKMVQPWGLPQK